MHRRLRRWTASLLLLAGPACCPAGIASAQSAQPDRVVAPHLDGTMLRSRLAAAMAPPGRPLPADAAALDIMVARKDWTALTARLRDAPDATSALLDMDWAQTTLFNGGGFLVAVAYMNDLWRVGSALPGEAGEQMKQTAGMTFLYALDLVRLDGVKCADASAPGHRQDQLIAQSKALLSYVRTLPIASRMKLGTISLAIEAATAAVRTDDDTLCSGGLDQLSAGLKAQGDRPLKRVPALPGVAGRTYGVPTAPAYTPRFVAAALWRPKQAAIRAALPDDLTTFLTISAETPAAAGR